VSKVKKIIEIWEKRMIEAEKRLEKPRGKLTASLFDIINELKEAIESDRKELIDRLDQKEKEWGMKASDEKEREIKHMQIMASSCYSDAKQIVTQVLCNKASKCEVSK